MADPTPDRAPAFGDRVRAALDEQGVSVRELARRTHFDHAYLSRVLAGKQRPSAGLAEAVDRALGAGGALAAAAEAPARPAADETGAMLEFMRRAETSDLGPGTLDVLDGAVHQLCRDYPTMPGPQLRDRSKALMERAVSMLDGRLTLAQHRDVLVMVGWLAALVGCVHFDVGDRPAAEAARRAVRQLGEQTGHGEIIGWSFEMAAWFALTEGRYGAVVEAAEAGQQHAGVTSAGVQLALQEAKARARMGDDRAHDAITTGRALLRQLPRPDHPEHHFIFDPSKYEFYAATIYTLLGWDQVAAEHCAEVVRQCEQPAGTRWPMRLADVRIDLGMLAARRGDLDEAVHLGAAAFAFDRRSGSLVSRAGDLLGELEGRYGDDRRVSDYRDRVAAEAEAAGW
ncbi:helix-turn-helix transcriptional regulator [Streptomonospora sp. PA3]|uniref:helix-turn-helix domain-containing protein n=1 Tax=Streptomonospora sp. PA3 TaxID=2607326 RepID=UPI0012DC703F|nr:helix-turn-helix transcriptional regulator [Streptomonospora sp. PA3]MUL39704.1 helix-turn-helix transcriptional regulator [Streptomonospora sp. PA3]